MNLTHDPNPTEHWKQKLERDVAILNECLKLARKLRDEPYDSREEFTEDLNTLCDKVSLLRDRL